jgi:hypothetical protein
MKAKRATNNHLFIHFGGNLNFLLSAINVVASTKKKRNKYVNECSQINLMRNRMNLGTWDDEWELLWRIEA